jgi:hypothetical protein
MPDGFEIKIDRGFQKKARGIIEKYDFEVGILKNVQHRGAKDKKHGFKTVAGGIARRSGSKPTSKSVAEVSQMARKRTGINFYTKPFQSRKNKDILRFIRNFFDFTFGRSKEKRLINTMQAIVRNPLTRGDYGGNRSQTAKRKGFSRLLIDSGQLFQNIRARVRRRNVS